MVQSLLEIPGAEATGLIFSTLRAVLCSRSMLLSGGLKCLKVLMFGKSSEKLQSDKCLHDVLDAASLSGESVHDRGAVFDNWGLEQVGENRKHVIKL